MSVARLVVVESLVQTVGWHMNPDKQRVRRAQYQLQQPLSGRYAPGVDSPSCVAPVLHESAYRRAHRDTAANHSRRFYE